MSHLFKEDTRIYKYFINKGSPTDEDDCQLLQDIFKIELVLSDKSEKQALVNLYNIVGFDAFFELIGFFDGDNIKLPKSSQIKSYLVNSIAYYYINIKKMSPLEFKKSIICKINNEVKQKNIKANSKKLERNIEDLLDVAIKHAQEEAANGNRQQ